MEDIKVDNGQEKGTALAVAAETGMAVVAGPGTKGEIPVGAYVLSLLRTYTYEDSTYERFVFDFEKLTGDDLINIENEMAAMGEIILAPETSTSFLGRMAARAAGVGSDVISGLPVRDFMRVKNLTQNFLTGTGSGKRTR